MTPVVEKKSRLPLILGIVLACGVFGGGAALLLKGGDAPKKKAAAPTVINITLPPPLPPPPPPPPPPQNEPPPPEEEKMVEADPITEEPPPDQAPSPEQPPAELTTNLGGGDGNGFGLTQGSGRGSFGSGGGTTIGGTGGKYSRFNSGLARSVESAMKRHPATRNASFPACRVALWVDGSGLITRAKLLDSTGDATTDRAITAQILTGSRHEAPPADMKQPIVMRLSARRP